MVQTISTNLGTSLAAAVSGLRATQTGIDLISRNIANATTEGYTRKKVQQVQLIIAGKGQGVRVGEIERYVNARLQLQARQSSSQEEAYRVRDTFLSQLETSLGKPGDNTSIASIMGQLADAFRQLATSPDVITAQVAAISKADTLARSFNDLTKLIQVLRTDAETAIKASVDDINARLVALDDLNEQIGEARALHQSTADLEDQRDIVLSEIAKEMPITYFERENGHVWIVTSDGRTLMDDEPHPLNFANSFQVNASLSYPGSLNGIIVDGVDIMPALTSGRLGGLFELRDKILTQAQQQLDELAGRTASLFALQDMDIFNVGAESTLITGRTATGGAPAGATTFTDSGGGAGLTVGMMVKFTGHDTIYEVTALAGATVTIAPVDGSVGLQAPVANNERLTYVERPSTAGYAGRFKVNPIMNAEPWRARDGTFVTAPNPNEGDETLPLNVVNMFESLQPFSPAVGLGSPFTLEGYAAAFITFQGTQRSNTSELLKSQESLTTSLKTRLENESGVNVDQELALMIELQNAYAANARVVQTVRQLFDDLLGMM